MRECAGLQSDCLLVGAVNPTAYWMRKSLSALLPEGGAFLSSQSISRLRVSSFLECLVCLQRELAVRRRVHAGSDGCARETPRNASRASCSRVSGAAKRSSARAGTVCGVWDSGSAAGARAIAARDGLCHVLELAEEHRRGLPAPAEARLAGCRRGRGAANLRGPAPSRAEDLRHCTSRALRLANCARRTAISAQAPSEPGLVRQGAANPLMRTLLQCCARRCRRRALVLRPDAGAPGRCGPSSSRTGRCRQVPSAAFLLILRHPSEAISCMVRLARAAGAELKCNPHLDYDPLCPGGSLLPTPALSGRSGPATNADSDAARGRSSVVPAQTSHVTSRCRIRGGRLAACDPTCRHR